MKHLKYHKIYEASVSADSLEKLEITDELFSFIQNILVELNIPERKELHDRYKKEIEHVKDIWLEIQYDCKAKVWFEEYIYEIDSNSVDKQFMISVYESIPRSVLQVKIINIHLLKQMEIDESISFIEEACERSETMMKLIQYNKVAYARIPYIYYFRSNIPYQHWSKNINNINITLKTFDKVEEIKLQIDKIRPILAKKRICLLCSWPISSSGNEHSIRIQFARLPDVDGVKHADRIIKYL